MSHADMQLNSLRTCYYKHSSVNMGVCWEVCVFGCPLNEIHKDIELVSSDRNEQAAGKSLDLCKGLETK